MLSYVLQNLILAVLAFFAAVSLLALVIIKCGGRRK